ncbi:MAG: MBL fold metallo-hydrolase [Hyphomicrobiaceae bacterium]
MDHARREFLITAAASGAITLLPFGIGVPRANADAFKGAGGEIKVHPVSHASFVMETPVGTIYCDPVGEPSSYVSFPKPDLILVTHRHGDHYKSDTLAAIQANSTEIITCPDVLGMMPANVKSKARAIANGQGTDWKSLKIDAIPAHNLTEGRLKFHPKGRDNGYVLNFNGFKIYISGDTEDVPEMRSLKDVDIAFVCMNLPFTMTAESAASAVAEFKPKFVYPYHYRGRDGGTQDPKKFARLVGKAADVKLVDWYPKNDNL